MSRQQKLRLGALAGLLGVIPAAILILSANGRGNVQAPAVAPAPVEVTPVATGTITETVSAVGRIAAMTDVRISSETAGRVTRVLAEVGDRVRAGQPLVMVDDELRALAVEQARAQRLAAETQFTKARGDAARAEQLHATGDVSNTELEAYQLGLRSAEAAFTSADVALRLARRQLEDTRIKSPINGFVAARSVDVGEMVAPGTEIANVVDLSRVKVLVDIPEEEITKLRPRQPVSVHVDAAPERSFEGMVLTVGKKSLGSNGHRYPVEVVVENKDTELLKAGMFARVEVRSRTVKDVPVVSRQSLVGDDGAPAVFVADSGSARLRRIRLGLQNDSAAQVLDGLHPGELVVSFGQKKLADGVPIRYER